MPKITKAIGSGMTERGVVEFDWSEANDVQVLIQAASEASNRSSFDRLSRKLEVLATQILEDAELPSDPKKAYLISDEGAWAAVEKDVDFGPEIKPVSFAEAYMLYELVPDSPEGYAVQVLMLLQTAHQLRETDSIDEAMALAFAVGELANEAGMKDLFEADFTTGGKVRAGGREAHEKLYGTEAEKAARQDAYLQEYDRLRATGMKKMRAYELAAEKFDVSAKTVQRAVKLRSSD